MPTSADSESGRTRQPAQRSRLFFALWPGAVTRGALDRAAAQLARHWGGRRMRADTLHLTLAFLGDTPEPMRARLLEAITTIPIGPLALRFEGAGYWAHNRIGWLRPQPDARLNALAVALREQLRVLAVPFDARAFVPHVTLLRHTAGGAPPVCAPVRWRADDFVLVESRPDDGGAHYTVLKRWALC